MRTPTILHVDDDESDLLIFRCALVRAGVVARLVETRSVEQAMAYLQGTPPSQSSGADPTPDLVIVDLRMPGRDGFQLLQWMRYQPRFDAVPIYVLSASDDPADLDRATRLGATRYFIKATLFVTIIDELKETLRAAPPSEPH